MRYVALLRGIGPLNPNMRNANFRDVLGSLGYRHILTVTTTGNLIFTTGETDSGATEERIEAAWPAHLGFTSTTILRSAEEWRALIKSTPFGDRDDPAGARLNVTFLQSPVPGLTGLHHMSEGDGWSIIGATDREVFSVSDSANPRSASLMRWIERAYGPHLTTRTWRVVNKINARL